MPAASAPTTDFVPSLAGRTFVVTGSNSGIGFEAVRVLARRGGRVVMACRDLQKGETARDAVRRESPDADVSLRELDLASLDSVRKFAEGLLADEPRLHVLVNNAGVMALPYRKTADGFEMQIGTNHLGHFALTGLLLGRLLETGSSDGGARVVTVSSTAHKPGRIRFDDLHYERGGYGRLGTWRAYAQSKLANLLFTFELQRRLGAAGRAECIAVACHPGYAATELQHRGPQMLGSRLQGGFMSLLNRVAAQSAEGGALPTLYAACADDVEGGEYFGPGGFQELAGPPKRCRAVSRAYDAGDAARLWARSEEETGVRFSELGGAP